jgi:hypothetical protein
MPREELLTFDTLEYLLASVFPNTLQPSQNLDHSMGKSQSYKDLSFFSLDEISALTEIQQEETKSQWV